MATIQTLQSLAAGSAGTTVVSSSNVPTIVVNQNSVSDNGACLPCEDQGCVVGVTQATTLDLGQFRTGGGTKWRANFVNGTTGPQHLTHMAGLFAAPLVELAPNFAPLPQFADTIVPNAFTQPLFTVNGTPNAGDLASVNFIGVHGGALVSQIMTRAVVTGNTLEATDAANQAFIDSGFTTIHYPVNPEDSTIRSIVYDPFCDACFSTNNGNVSTKQYTGSFPLTWRDNVDFLIPAGARGIIEFCYTIIDLPNTQADTAAHQWLLSFSN